MAGAAMGRRRPPRFFDLAEESDEDADADAE